MAELSLIEAKEKNCVKTKILDDYEVDWIKELRKWSYNYTSVQIYKVKAESDFYLLKSVKSLNDEHIEDIQKLHKLYQEYEKKSNHLLKTLKTEEEEGNIEILYECSDKDLNSICKDSKDVTRRMKEILEPLTLFEEQKIPHLELKPNNIFIVDGITKIVYLVNPLASQSIKERTDIYLPPEVNGNKEFDPSKVDVYSWGRTFDELLSAEIKDKNYLAMLKELEGRELWVEEALEKALCDSPEERASFKDLKAAISDSTVGQGSLKINKEKYERKIKKLEKNIEKMEKDKGT